MAITAIVSTFVPAYHPNQVESLSRARNALFMPARPHISRMRAERRTWLVRR
ncbi:MULTISPECIES: hypothetical protein [Streptomyces]|uniref:hypothetical protein n=1 Tax=Streptomyces TaxID=1883 RepID=UPI000B03BE7E|nr:MULTISPECIES: hypothetical protein [unclassified Streptomyces]